jgi:nanoRNase/pAp phosphatase (c-di-AMP/oligoRNAs hydrolase)
MRLLTRSDFDGLACGSMLKALGIIDTWKFVHPKDMQDGAVEVTGQDVLANVPYVPGCGMWFDHHATEIARIDPASVFIGESRPAPSAARVIFDYYGGEARPELTHFREFVTGVDKVDSGLLTVEEVLNPGGWVLLGFIMDPRTGLGRFREFSITNYDLMLKLMDLCGSLTIDEILELPDIRERVKLYGEHAEKFAEMIHSHTQIKANVIFTDLRGERTIFTGNRFMLYSLYPEQNVSVWIVDGRGNINCPIAVGHSVINRTCKSDIGELMYKYGGGGHRMVGPCQVDYDDADDVVEEIIGKLIEDNKNPPV